MLETSTETGLRPLNAPEVCERCAGLSPALVDDGQGERVCRACATGLRPEEAPPLKLWPAGFLWALGLLLPSAAAVLALVSWRRLGDRLRTHRAAGLVLLALGADLLLWPDPNSNAEEMLGMALNVLLTAAAVRDLGPVYLAHRARGGERAELLLPLVISLAALLVLSLVGGVPPGATPPAV